MYLNSYIAQRPITIIPLQNLRTYNNYHIRTLVEDYNEKCLPQSSYDLKCICIVWKQKVSNEKSKCPKCCGCENNMLSN